MWVRCLLSTSQRPERFAPSVFCLLLAPDHPPFLYSLLLNKAALSNKQKLLSLSLSSFSPSPHSLLLSFSFLFLSLSFWKKKERKIEAISSQSVV